MQAFHEQKRAIGRCGRQLLVAVCCAGTRPRAAESKPATQGGNAHTQWQASNLATPLLNCAGQISQTQKDAWQRNSNTLYLNPPKEIALAWPNQTIWSTSFYSRYQPSYPLQLGQILFFTFIFAISMVVVLSGPKFSPFIDVQLTLSTQNSRGENNFFLRQ